MITRSARFAGAIGAALLTSAAVACNSGGKEQAAKPASEQAPRLTREMRDIDAALTPSQASAAAREGVAAAIMIDVSGSMDRPASGGDRVKKIVVARRAAMDLVNAFSKYATDHPQEPVLLGIYEFSRLPGRPDSREVIPMGPPALGPARAAVDRMAADGGTPIGNAMIAGKLALEATGLSRRHLLVITDGENTDGYGPDDVAAGLGRAPDTQRPSLYFVAFDVDARRFERVKTAGGLVLEAANAQALNQTLDSLLRGSILVEK